MSKRKIPDTGGRDVWFEVGTFSLDGVRSFRFLKKKKKKIPYGLTNLGHFCLFLIRISATFLSCKYVWINMQIAKMFVEMFQNLCNNMIWISIKNLHRTNLNSNKTNTQKNLLNPIQPDLISVNCRPPLSLGPRVWVWSPLRLIFEIEIWK